MSTYATPSAASSSPFTSTVRSLLSRLTNPLNSRTRNLTDFYIEAQEPHRQYSPGDLVKGAVVLTVAKPIRITHLTVCLHGFVRVFKNQNAANEPLPIVAGLTPAPSSNSGKSQYFGNGHASLFQDEQTLCGEGRLEAGAYHFNFELEFPTKGLPTSLDFERGTISYMITSTLTRPTSIAATSSCDQKLSLVETVDIGPMNPPRPRTISLEPISRRAGRRKKVKSKQGSTIETKDVESGSEVTRVPDSPRPDESASQCGLVDNANPRSPAPSDVHSTTSVATSAESTMSGNSSSRLGPIPSSSRSARNNKRCSRISIPGKTITATIELSKSGCLPGDNISLKINIKHTKAIKSMHGIIITLYRQGRIDSAPPLSLFTDIKGKAAEKLKHEEYYPKSKTGLGGLSLSSAGSSSVFRKDLSQTFAPLLVDPSTLTAAVTASVRVPEDVFPTIKGVPGEMISFKYHIEVVVDLGGKLAGQQRHLPRVGAITLPANHGSSGSSASANMLAAWGGSIVDTDYIRREKSVVACLFEVVVGSMDSARRQGRGSTIKKQMNDWSEEGPVTSLTPYDSIYGEPPQPTTDGGRYGDEQQQSYEPNYEDQNPGYYGDEGHDHHTYDWHPEEHPSPSRAQIPVPAPDIQEDGLTEKERARRAEARLLPSQPPQDIEDPSASTAPIPVNAPSAPPQAPEEEEDLYSAEDGTPHATSSHFPSLSVPSNPPESAPHGPHRTPDPNPAPSAPTLDDLAPAATANPSEDKQELERQRILAEASTPPKLISDEDEVAGESEGGGAVQHMPSAPILSEDDEFVGCNGHVSLEGPSMWGEVLPRYER